MATVLDNLVVNLIGKDQGFGQMMRDATASTKQFDSAANTVLGTLSSFGVALGGVGLAKQMVGLAAAAEKMQISFTVMLGSAAKAQTLVKDIQKYAADTPLTTSDIQSATKTLLQFGTAAEDLIPTIKAIGDVTGGGSDEFQRMSLAFGQVSATGRLMGQDLNQMINAGFNPLKEISRTTGKSMATLKQEMEEGKISVAQVEKAFKTATQTGGPFAGLLKELSGSMTGLQSTLSDDIDAFLRTVGEDVTKTFKLKEGLKELSKVAQELTTWWKGLTPQMKSWITLAATAAAGGFALSATLGIVKFAFGGLTQALMVGLGPLGQYIAKVGVLKAAFVGLQAAGIAAAGYLAFRLGDSFVQGRKEQQDLGNELNKSKINDNKIGGIQQRGLDGMLNDIAGMPTPEAKLDALNAAKVKLEANLKGARSGVKNEQANVAQSRDNPYKYLQDQMGWNADADQFRDNLAGATANVERYEKALEKVSAELDAITKEKKQALFAVGQEVKKLADEIFKSANNMGKSPFEQQLALLAKTPGITPEQIASLKARIQLEKKLNEEYTVRLKYVDQMRDMRAEYAAGGVEGPRGEILKDIAKYKLDPKEFKEQLEMIDKLDAMKLNDQFASPADKAAKEQNRLNVAFQTGELSADAYNRALMESVKTLNDLQGVTQSLQGVGMGSAEYYANLAQYQRAQDAPRAMQNRIKDLARGGPNGTPVNQNGQRTKAESLLEQIRDAIRADKKGGGVVLKPAELSTGFSMDQMNADREAVRAGR